MILYAHKNRKTNEIFYIGIGQNEKRAFNTYNRNKLWKAYVKKNGNPVIEIWITNLKKTDAFLWEIFYIKLFGKKINGGMLVNLSDGGEGGGFGVVRTDKFKEKLRSANTGVVFSEERKQRIRDAAKGRIRKPHSDETKEKMRLAALGKKKSPETRKKLSESRKGIKIAPFSDEHRRKIGDANRKRKGMKFKKKDK